MADIQAFRGLRYDLSKVGSLSEVVAPPYDVISQQLQRELYAANDYNFVRLILPQTDDLMGDETVYDRAAHDLKTWRREGVLREDGAATIYVYHQRFEFEGVAYCRRGFLSRVKVEPLSTGTIFPHEQTHSAAKDDRYRLMTRCGANLSPVFGLYPDPENVAQELLESAIGDRTPLTAVDPDGVQHQLWQVTDPEAISAAAAILGTAPVYIADGHHRYETACRIKEEARAKLDSDDGTVLPTDYTLMMFVSMSDPGLAVLPTHRLFRGIETISSSNLIDKLGDKFETEVVGRGAKCCGDVWDSIQIEAEQTTIGFYCGGDDTWLLARLTVEGIAAMERLEPDQSDCWRSLGVSLLHRLVVEELLGERDLPTPKYVHDITEVVDGIRNGDDGGRDATGQTGTGAAFGLAALVMPARVDDVKAISDTGLRMPAKSTYFYPKLLSGLVVNPLE